MRLLQDKDLESAATRTDNIVVPVVVIGAGPHGLAATAYLRHAGVETAIFGEPMAFWREQMPAGMLLRSALRATNIASPERTLSLDRWSEETGRDVVFPLPLPDFIDYAEWYRGQVAPDLDRRKVERIERYGDAFRLLLSDGEEVRAERVAVAAGIAPFPRIPRKLASLRRELVSHSSQHSDLSHFRGRRVAVLGAGQSALESAALLKESGAEVQVIHRKPAIKWLGGPPSPGEKKKRRRRLKLSVAPTDLGGPRASWLSASPDIFRRFPRSLQETIAFRAIGPAGGHWLRDRVEGIPIAAGRSLEAVQHQNGNLRLTLSDGSDLEVDHLLLGTGYEIDVSKYEFLGKELADAIKTVDGYPVLGPGLESSVPGLHFLGAPAAYSFGPVMRFVTGTWYTAPAFTLRALGRRQPLVRWSF
jgi:Pyridine nucleotide-disulphide oxidoreductase